MKEIHSMLVIRPHSAHNVIVYFMDEMEREWTKEGLETEELYGENEKLQNEQMKNIAAGKYDLVFSFNGMGLATPQFVDCLQKGETVYCTMLVDHPMHHHVRLTADFDRMFVFAPDYYHVQYLNDYYPHIMAEAFLPYGGCAVKKVTPYRDRQMSISFVGRCPDPKKRRAEFAAVGGGNQTLRLLLTSIVRMMEKNVDMPIEEAFAAGLADLKVELSRPSFARMLALVMAPADSYVRDVNRKRVIQALLDAHLAVDVYGGGWEEFDGTNREYLRIHPPIDFNESLEVAANSKFFLNVMPDFKAGSQERVFNAMGCGALALTDTSRYWEDLAAPGVLIYRLDELDRLPELVNYYMAHEAEAEELSVQGQANFNRAHTWAHRAREVMQYLEEWEQIFGSELP